MLVLDVISFLRGGGISGIRMWAGLDEDICKSDSIAVTDYLI